MYTRDFVIDWLKDLPDTVNCVIIHSCSDDDRGILAAYDVNFNCLDSLNGSETNL